MGLAYIHKHTHTHTHKIDLWALRVCVCVVVVVVNVYVSGGGVSTGLLLYRQQRARSPPAIAPGPHIRVQGDPRRSEKFDPIRYF